MKQIAVVAMEKEYAAQLHKNLETYLSPYAKVKHYSVDEIKKTDHISADLIVIATFTIFEVVKQKMSSSSELIVVTVTPNKENLEPLKNLVGGTRALLVNYDYRTCVQCITNLYAAGFNNLELIPYHGGEYDESVKLAITPNESRLVPEKIKDVIDIGESIIEYNSLYRIAEKLGAADRFATNEGVEAKRIGYFSNLNMERILGENQGLSEKVNVLIKLMKQGILLTDAACNVLTANAKARQILSSRCQMLEGFRIEELIPEMIEAVTENKNDESYEEIISVGDKNVIATLTKIVREERIYGYIIALDDFEEVEEKQHGIRTKLSETGHKARYTFNDIKGNSKALRETLLIARRMTKSEASVMITGESGTGKEVFAQSIHNESKRKDYNFVAVNCAAIPENLLESEMFGHEEGSFTGAKKGGKVGYFELAHKGTIFLDEIGEMPLSLQAKLLRVIEERKIVRVGASNAISVDVRIISATNKDLYDMVEKGTFREDLYYRLNVLPLFIPGIRERKEDIEILIEHFSRQLNCNFSFTEEAQKVLDNHYWKGNIREIRNVVEFTANLGKEIVGAEDLPKLKGQTAVETCEVGEILDSPQLNKKFLLYQGRDLDLYEAVLAEMEQAYGKREKLGRQAIQERIAQRGVFYTEGEIRRALLRLSEYGYIKSPKGRGGSTITGDGVALKKEIEQLHKKGY